jgi:hypothetical protein
MPQTKRFVKPTKTLVEVPVKPGERGIAQTKEIPVVANIVEVAVPEVLTTAQIEAILAAKKA